MDLSKIVNTAGVIILGLLMMWLFAAMKRDSQRRKNKKK
jgi:hypothetical protein